MGPIFVSSVFLFDFQIIELCTLFLDCPGTKLDTNPGVGTGTGTVEFPVEDKDYEANLNCLIKVSLPEGKVYILGQ